MYNYYYTCSRYIEVLGVLLFSLLSYLWLGEREMSEIIFDRKLHLFKREFFTKSLYSFNRKFLQNSDYGANNYNGPFWIWAWGSACPQMQNDSLWLLASWSILPKIINFWTQNENINLLDMKLCLCTSKF